MTTQPPPIGGTYPPENLPELVELSPYLCRAECCQVAQLVKLRLKTGQEIPPNGGGSPRFFLYSFPSGSTRPDPRKGKKMIVNQKSPKVSGCLVCGFRTENSNEIELMRENGCPVCAKEKEIRSMFIECREWFDKTYGNSYFSARIWINGKWKITLPFQYGYGDHFKSVAVRALVEEGFIPEQYENRSLNIVAEEMRFDCYTSKALTTKKEMFKESK